MGDIDEKMLVLHCITACGRIFCFGAEKENRDTMYHNSDYQGADIMSIFGRKEIAELRAELRKKEQELEKTKELLKKTNEVYAALEHKEKDKPQCDNGNDSFRKRIIQDKDLAKSVYDRKWNFTSWYETRLYELLCDIVASDALKKYELKVFSQVRLADIVKVREENLEKFKSNIGFLTTTGASKTNRSKAAVYEEMIKAGFDDKKYKQVFLYPLLRSHVDFLICRGVKTLTPIMVIELFGQEHFDLDWKHKELQRNDEFKKHLFEAVGIGFDNSLKNDTLKEALKNNDKLNELKSELEGKILGHIREYDGQSKKNAKIYSERQAYLMANS